jgi:hypothetical protein
MANMLIHSEISQVEYERLEVRAQAARQRFLAELAAAPRAQAAWRVLQRAEHEAFEARRARREAEVHSG